MAGRHEVSHLTISAKNSDTHSKWVSRTHLQGAQKWRRVAFATALSQGGIRKKPRPAAEQERTNEAGTSCPVALLIFFAGAAGTGVVASHLVVTAMGCLRGDGLFPAVHCELWLRPCSHRPRRRRPPT